MYNLDFIHWVTKSTVCTLCCTQTIILLIQQIDHFRNCILPSFHLSIHPASHCLNVKVQYDPVFLLTDQRESHLHSISVISLSFYMKHHF